MKQLATSFLLALLVILMAGCKKGNNTLDISTSNPQDIESLQISDDFDYVMTNELTLDIQVLDYQDKPMPNIGIRVYTTNPELGGKGIAKGQTLDDGHFRKKVVLSQQVSQIYIEALVLGLPNRATVSVGAGGAINYTFGGEMSRRRLRGGLAQSEIPAYPSKGGFRSISQTPAYHYMGAYNSVGLPNYLIAPDTFDNDFISDVNASLPENQPVPTYNPSYLSNAGSNTVIELGAQADVWLTFVHEGAGYKNTLAYYTYQTGNPPTSLSDIDSLHIIFPNMSFYSSGAMLSGDKVHLGTFPAGTGIGWALIADGWNPSTQTIKQGGNIFYSNSDWNPETNPAQKQHVVILNDKNRELLLIGFEDQHRNASDNDFNDAVFYTTVNPVTAVVNQNSFQDVKNTATDTDGDGVPDYNDDYPNDPSKAFNNYYPSSTTYGSLAFEDMWPNKDDYDCNDLVVDYRFLHIANASNEVLEMEAELVVKAIGAAQHNGLGFELGISPNQVTSATGQKMFRNYISLGANGCELNQSKAVIFAFDDPHLQMSPPTGFTVNTEPNKTFITPDTTRLKVVFSSPIDEATLGLPPYNPFLVRNRDRDYEIHLPDYAPTDLADPSLFGTADDDSNPSTGRYYKSPNNLPWAMHFPERFEYPIEHKSILQTHLNFGFWAQSSGLSYRNWYQDVQGYRQDLFIYK